MTFEEANKQWHPVEKEWHYNILIKYGFVPDTSTAQGMVRSYCWHHPTTNNRICFSIGVNADYWRDLDNKAGHGYWSDLEPYLKQLTERT